MDRGPGGLQSMGSQRAGHNRVSKQQQITLHHSSAETWKVLCLCSVAFKWKLYETKLQDPTSISSYPRILTFGSTPKMIGTSAENFLENSILYPSYVWIPTPTSSVSDETGILSLLTPKLAAWGYSFNIVSGCCAWEWKCVYWGFFFFFYLWELIAEMIFGVGDAVIGFGPPLGRRATINHALRSVNLGQTAALRRWIRECSFWQKLLCWSFFSAFFPWQLINQLTCLC